MKIYRKILTAVLTIALVISAVPFNLEEANASSIVRGTFSRATILKNAEGKTYSYPAAESRFMQIYFSDYMNNKFKVGNCSEGGVGAFRLYKVNGEIAYCVEHGVEVDETAKFNGSIPMESMLEKIYINEGKEYILRNISLCLFYGRQKESRIEDLLGTPDNGGLDFRNSRYYGMNAEKYTLDDWYAATKQLIHETQQQFRTENFSLKATNDLEYTNGLRMNDGSRFPGNGQKIRNTHYVSALKGKGAYDIYKFMEQLIKNHFKISPSVGGMTKEKPVEIILTENQETGVWESKPIYVKSSIASKLKIVNKSGKAYKDIRIELKQNSDGRWYYKYTYNTADEPNTKDVFTLKRAVQGREDFIDTMLVWECRDGRGGHEQALATGAADPISRYVKFSTDIKPTVPSGERPEPDYFPTIEIPVKKQDANPGWDGDANTPMGDAGMDATYTLYKSVNGGEEIAVDSVTLDEYGNEDVLTDLPFSAPLELSKTESGEYTHTEQDNEGNATTHCSVTPTKIEWSGSVSYRVVETRPDGRYIQPDNGYRTYSFNYYAMADDTRTCINDPENWSDIRYNIEYTTTSGTNREIESVQGTSDDVSDQKTLEYNQEIFLNDCYRGKFTLSKSLENEDVFHERGSGLQGGEIDSIGSLWKIRLKSGGYENHPYVRFIREEDEKSGTAVYRVVRDTSGDSNADESIKIGSNGDLYVYDIPYGEYVVEEYEADDDSFVKEEFTLSIGEHNQSTYSPEEENDNRYGYNLRDKKKTNIIKVIKTNAETGKTVTAAGTKFYLRYMGNPLYSEEENKKLSNYGRLLPNGEDITRKGPYTFETDKNGQITVPYELEYGIYRLEEWLLPEGYFIGAYDETGKGSSHDYGNVEERQTKVLSDINSFESLVSIYDREGNPVKYKDKSEYVLGNTGNENSVFNYYTFNVEKQYTHVDGNFGQLVDCNGNITEADPAYNHSDYPYTAHYRAVAMTNNMTKGKIQVKKTGEYLYDFIEAVKNGNKVMQPVYKMGPLSGAIFGIFAAEDILLNDGNEGPKLYDSKTKEEISIPQLKSTHSKRLIETVKTWFSKVFSGSVYEEGELTHSSGAKLWYLKDRTEREDGRNTTVYVSPEQKNTAYTYTYETSDEEAGLKYRYDMTVVLKHQADGKDITDTKMIKTTIPLSESLTVIPQTEPVATVGEQVLNPIDNYFPDSEIDNGINKSKLTVSKQEYKYEDSGTEGTEGTEHQDENESLVQVYDSKFVCDENDSLNFSISWDGFIISSAMDSAKKVPVTTITKQDQSIAPSIDSGAGYTYEVNDNKVTFIPEVPSSPVYFENDQGIKTEMYYAGGVMKAQLTIPESAVSTYFEGVMPQVKLLKDNIIIDWYSKLSPDNPAAEQMQSESLSWKATRCESESSEEDVYYTLELATNAGIDEAIEISFEDGYSMTLFCGKAESGNNVGVIFADGIYKTNRHTMSNLVETITTDEEGIGTSTNLPLGKYIVRELSAPEEHIWDDRGHEVELKYNNQYVPLVWKNIESDNEHYNVEINFKKVFETWYQSDEYALGGGAVFGIYNAASINYGEKSLPANSLLDAVNVNSSGTVLSDVKLPKGVYYLKELKTVQGYELCTVPFYFVVGEDNFSNDAFTVKDDLNGVYAKGYLNGFGDVRLIIKVLKRYPMPAISIDGKEYSLSVPAKGSNFEVSSEEDATWVSLNITPDNPADVLLPNGKQLIMSTDGNTYEYQYDGKTGKYIPLVTDTGYFAKYSLEETESQKKSRTIVLTGADRASQITAKSVYNIIDGDENEIKKDEYYVLLTGDMLEEPVRVDRGEAETVPVNDGTSYYAKLSKEGVLELSVRGTLKGQMTELNQPELTVDGVLDDSLEIYKSVTMARQDSFSHKVQIKINTSDNISAGEIKNNMTPTENPPKYSENGKLEIFKADANSMKPLSGATFEIWSSTLNEKNIPVPDKVIYTGTTGNGGKLSFDVNFGKYFYKEIKAPAGYICDDRFYEADVADNVKIVRVNVVNEKEPEKPKKPQKPKKPEEPEGLDTPDTPKISIEPENPEVPKTKDSGNIMMWIYLALFFGITLCFELRKSLLIKGIARRK